MQSYGVTSQMKPVELYIHMALFITFINRFYFLSLWIQFYAGVPVSVCQSTETFSALLSLGNTKTKILGFFPLNLTRFFRKITPSNQRELEYSHDNISVPF